jgi:L-asparagine transporter-like permease
MLPIVNHIVYTFVILIACAYILHENTEDEPTKILLYKGITIGVMGLTFFIGTLISKFFDNMNGTVIYVGTIIFICVTSYFTFVNKKLLTENMLKILIMMVQ